MEKYKLALIGSGALGSIIGEEITTKLFKIMNL